MGGLVIERPAERVARIVLNRPDRRNALDDELLLHELPEAVDQVSADDTVGAVIVTGAGNAFCSGADLRCQGLAQGTVTASERYITASHQTPIKLRRMPKPVIAAVNGAAVGAGLGLALACDIRLASPDARFIAPFLRLGLPPDYGTSYFLPQAVGASFALEMVWTCRTVEAEEAVRTGLAARIEQDVQAAAVELAKQVATAGPAYAIAVTKHNIFRGLETDMESAILDNEVRSLSIALHGEEFAGSLAGWQKEIIGRARA